jgi:DNA helicase HerA-like ATPase
VITLCTQGRKRGYCAVLATQRLSKLHKDAAAELLNKLIGRTGLDVDVKRAGDELGFDKEQRQTLKTLAPGTFYAYGPAVSQTGHARAHGRHR